MRQELQSELTSSESLKSLELLRFMTLVFEMFWLSSVHILFFPSFTPHWTAPGVLFLHINSCKCLRNVLVVFIGC